MTETIDSPTGTTTSTTASRRPPVDAANPTATTKPAKLFVWDGDLTVLAGTFLEDPNVAVRPEIAALIRHLDALGVLHSLASRNDPELLLPHLEQAGIGEYFLHPRIQFDNSPKSAWIERIARDFGLGLESIVFVDDQAFERAEVAAALPQVTVLDVADILVDVDAFLRGPHIPRGQPTPESRGRRASYRAAAAWSHAERQHVEDGGDLTSFLATTDLHFSIGQAEAGDLDRMRDLTVRTHQLNSTGTVYAKAELDELRASPNHLVLIAGLRDRFDDYGRIGLALVERLDRTWHLHLLLLSCRILTRGVGQVMLHHILERARDAGASELLADYVEIRQGRTIRNRQMYLAYKFAGFDVLSRQAENGGQDGEGRERVVFRHSLATIPAIPDWVTVEVTS